MEFNVRAGEKVRICYNAGESEAVKTAAANLAADLKKVLSGVEVLQPAPEESAKDGVPEIVIGTIGVGKDTAAGADSDKMSDENGRLRKEAYQLKVQEGRLYILGSDRRGTVYGIYTFCEWMGVSPWYFFADVPVRRKRELVLEEGYCLTDWPSVEYRGIFINDEEELDAWVRNQIGEPTIGVKSYEKIFELLLRLKANYIWPAMHVNSFNLSPENGARADRMGMVVGTSHCDMLMRSNNREWIPWIEKKGYTDAVYDYSLEGKNREILREYWKESVEQNRDFEVCYTLGMRGIHDSGFETRELDGMGPEELRRAKVELLGRVMEDQRKILRETLGHETMMTFIPYKEVLDLYDHGLEVPEDMTLVWANDNYGYIRRFPSEKEKGRKGGNGIYYHNSYWSPPSMSYVFLCSIPLAHTRSELKKAWDEGIRKLWVLNSGSIKPLEQEVTFFLRLAWEIGKPGALTEDVEAFAADWIDRTFTGKIGSQVSALLNDFSQITNVRKIENMDYDVFSQTAYGDEAAMRVHEYERLFEQGNDLYGKLPEEEKAAFFQMVLMRIHAAYFTNLAYYYGDRSTLAHERGEMQAAARYVEKCREADDARRKMLYYYNHVMCGGKWEGILNPEGFPPPRTAMLPVCTPPLAVTGEPGMRVDVWNGGEGLCFVTPNEKWVEIGNTGTGEFRVRLKAPEWVRISEKEAVIRTERRIMVSVEEIAESRQGEIVIENIRDGSIRKIPVCTAAPEYGNPGPADGWTAEEDGLVALEADAAQSDDFRPVRRLGRMRGNLMEACVQRSWDGESSSAAGRPLRYAFSTVSRGKFLLEIHRFPSLNSTGRIRAGISVDGGAVRIAESFSNDEWRGTWKRNVLDNAERMYMELPLLEAGKHELCVYAVDRYFAFSRLLIYTKPRKENSLAGIRGCQELPAEWETGQWCRTFYGEMQLQPRPVFYADWNDNRESLAVTAQMKVPDRNGQRITADWYLGRGNRIFGEESGAIRIDAAAALAESCYAWAKEPEGKDITGKKEFGKGITENRGKLWRHCGSESYGQSGLAMYIREPGLSWKAEEAPCLNYRICCGGGGYTLWILSKFSVREESFYAVGVDGKIIPAERLYGNGCPWKYEAEQVYRWIPAVYMELERGEHLLQVYALASGMRYDRFYLTGGKELPPVD